MNASTLQLVEQTLLMPTELSLHTVQLALQSLLSRQIDYADLYFQYRRSESWGLEDGTVKTGGFAIDQGVGVRAISGEKAALSYSDDLTLAALQSAIKTTGAIAQLGESRVMSSSAPSLVTRYPRHDPIQSLSSAQKVQLLEKLEHITRQMDTRIIKVSASLNAMYDMVLIVRHDGLINADIRPLIRLSLHVIAEENGRREQGTAGGGGTL